MALKKLCSRCQKNIVPINKKYCSECEKKADIERKERYKHYQKNRLEDNFQKRLQKFYQSKEWRVVREIVLLRDKGLCQLSLDENEIVFADVVHHIETIEENWNKRLDLDNLISLSISKHNHVHRQYSNNEKTKKEMQNKLKQLIDTG